MGYPTKPTIVFITGASGAGKTSVMRALEKQLPAKSAAFYYFDSIGVPTFDEMIAESGSLEAWQQQATKAWVQKLATISNKDIIFLEGQFNPDFAISECKHLDITKYHLLCLDVSDDERKHRLTVFREQPELADDNMMCWAKVLRDKTRELQGRVIDTTAHSITETVNTILRVVHDS